MKRSMFAVLTFIVILLIFWGNMAISTYSGDGTVNSDSLMRPGNLQKHPSKAPDYQFAYGTDSSQYGELRVPAGPGPHPVAILIHGGCFKAAYATLRDLSPMAGTLKEMGIATWNIEYRRLGQPGGGWPGTYIDVGQAIDYLRTLKNQYVLDLDRVIVVGHSAGGHLAMWAAARTHLPNNSDLYVANPLSISGVLDLAGPIDMTANIANYEELCRDNVITALLGGTPASVPERYAQTSAIKLLPLGIPQVLLIGKYEEFVPCPLMETYVRTATQAGDPVQLIVVPHVGHFEIASPLAATWPQVSSVIRSLLAGELPGDDSVGQILAVEHQRLRALVDADTITADLLHADDFQLISPLGGMVSRDDYLGMIASGDVDYLFWEPGEMEVRVYGNAAVIRYQAEIKIKVKWAPDAPEGKFWHTDLYEKQDGQWKVVWSQATQIK